MSWCIPCWTSHAEHIGHKSKMQTFMLMILKFFFSMRYFLPDLFGPFHNAGQGIPIHYRYPVHIDLSKRLSFQQPVWLSLASIGGCKKLCITAYYRCGACYVIVAGMPETNRPAGNHYCIRLVSRWRSGWWISCIRVKRPVSWQKNSVISGSVRDKKRIQ